MRLLFSFVPTACLQLWGVNSPSGCEVPLIRSQAEGWGTDPQSGLAVHVQAPRHHWRFGRRLQGRPVPCPTSHSGNWWKETAAVVPGQSFSGCQQKGQQWEKGLHLPIPQENPMAKRNGASWFHSGTWELGWVQAGSYSHGHQWL